MIFFHDHKFINKNGRIYTSGSLNNELFQRYLNWFGDVTVFANEKDAISEHESVINKYNEVTNVNFNLVNTAGGKRNLFTVIKKIKKAVNQHNYIIVRLPSFYGIIAVFYARKMKKKYLVELVGCPWDAFWNHSLKGKLIAPLMYLFVKKILKDAPYVLYVTSVFLQKRYPTNGFSIGCSDVILPPVENNLLNKRLKKKYSMNMNEPIILGTIGALNVQYKGQDSVIKAISKLIKEGYNINYHLVGNGDSKYLKDLSKKYGVEDKIVFLGTLPHDQIFEYLDNIDIYIQPSKTEGLPRALVEAMSRACPVIGSNAGGIPELLNEELTFSPGSVYEIYNLLKTIDEKMILTEVIRSFEKSKEFERELLDRKRNKLYNLFCEGENITND